jgi:hypothetical protein
VAATAALFVVVGFLFIQQRRTIRFNRPYAPYGAYFYLIVLSGSGTSKKTLRFYKEYQGGYRTSLNFTF